MTGSRRISTLAAIGTTCLLCAAPAGAEVSSVDAYGGQAAVLGKPHHKHAAHAAPGGARESGGEASGATNGSGASGSTGSSGTGGSVGFGGSGTEGATRHGANVGNGVATGSGGAALASSPGGSLSLSSLDWLLIVLVVLALVAVAVGVRRMERPAP